MISDRFTPWSLWVALSVIAIPLVLPIFLSIFPLFWLLLLFTALPVLLCALVLTLVLGLCAAWGAGLALGRGQWRRAISMLALPLAIILVVPMMEAGNKVWNQVRFLAHKTKYETAVAQARAEGKYFAWVDDWSLFVTSNQFVVWDEQDQIVLLRSEQTEAWRREAFPGGGATKYRVHQTFGGHYYLIDDD